MFCLSSFKYFYEALYFNRTSEDMCCDSFVFNHVDTTEPINVAFIGALFIKNIHRKDEIKSNYVCS